VTNLQSESKDEEIVEICISGINSMIYAADDFFRGG